MNIRGFLRNKRKAANLKQIAQESTSLRAKLPESALKIGLVSANEFMGKITDDFLIERAFLKRGFDAKRVSWEDTGIEFGGFDALLVTSMWGYQNRLDDFYDWLSTVEKSGVPIFNSAKIIRENCDKVKQFEILDGAEVPHIETAVFKNWDEDAEKEALARFGFPLVVKPTISASGEGVTLIREEADFVKNRDELKMIARRKSLLVQPFVPEIRDGELAVVLIDGKIYNVVRRFPGILDGVFHVEAEPIDGLSGEARKICEKIISAPEYKDALYTRVDLVKTADGYRVMEVEMFEPQLFYYLLKGEEQERMLGAMVEAVKKRLDAEGK